jgi:hypothetical protein
MKMSNASAAPSERAGERQGDPGEQRQEQQQHEDHKDVQLVQAEHEIHLVGPGNAQCGRAADHQQASRADAARRGGRPARRHRRDPQRLCRHRQRRFVRQCPE